jgi:tetratricopeptide (TPR) repeat protein
MTTTGEMSAGLSMYERALSIKRVALGEAHESVADTLNNMGLLLQQLGRHDDAAKVYGRGEGGHDDLSSDLMVV